MVSTSWYMGSLKGWLGGAGICTLGPKVRVLYILGTPKLWNPSQRRVPGSSSSKASKKEYLTPTTTNTPQCTSIQGLTIRWYLGSFKR